MSAALAPIEGFLHEYRCTRLDERPGEEPTPPALREGYYVVASSAEKAIERARDEHRDRQRRLRFEAEVTKRNYCCAKCRQPQLLCNCRGRR